MKPQNFAIPLILATVCFAGVSSAENAEKVLPKSGSLSSTVTGGYRGSMGVDVPWGENVLSEEPTSPITGSVSRVSPGQWVMRVFNNSEDRYSVNLEVAQYNIRGAQIKGDSFSYTLKAKEAS